jgi:hypothetical protein
MCKDSESEKETNDMQRLGLSYMSLEQQYLIKNKQSPGLR